MTSSYSEKITKLKNALENVFVKKTDIQNNLTSTDINKPLSANQGKILNTNKVDKISGKSLSTNDFTNTYKTKLDNLDTLLENKANNTHTHGNLQNDGSIGTSNNVNKNVITDGNGKITTEDKPTIPKAGTIVPFSDSKDGSAGNSDKWAKADHIHRKSNLYAESDHNHDNTYIKLSNTTGLVKNDGSIDTTSYLSRLPNHTHAKSEITDFTHTHSTATLETDGFLSMQDKAKLDNLSYDSGWQEVTFKSGYTRYNNSTSVYVRRKGDLVELTGVWKPTKTQSAASNPVAFASIPDELKPTKSINVICPGQSMNRYVLTVDTDANLKWSRYGANTSIDLPNGHFGNVHCTWTI